MQPKHLNETSLYDRLMKKHIPGYRNTDMPFWEQNWIDWSRLHYNQTSDSAQNLCFEGTEINKSKKECDYSISSGKLYTSLQKWTDYL